MEALEAHGGVKARAAESLGLPENTYRDRLKLAVRRGLIDPPPASPNPPEGMVPTGISILSNSDGEIQRWEKFKAEDYNRQIALEETVRAFTEPLRGLGKPTKAPKATDADLKTEYILTDLHLGQYSWIEETGDNYDLDVATDLASSAIDRLVDSSPASEIGLLNQLGDFFHADGNVPMTPRGGNVLDTDTRHRKVLGAGVQLIRYAVDRMLQKHASVEIRNTPGNHDPHSGMVLDFALKAYFENEQRVTVHDSPKPFWAYEFGKCLVGIAHGHAPKPKMLPGLLAADYPEAWGRTEFKYCRHGHLHNEQSATEMGVRREGFATLAAKDAWTTGEGYRSARNMVSIVLHKDYGEIERHTAGIRRVKE